MRNGEVIERPVDHRTLTARYTDEAVRFIGANRSRPFFLYLAHSLPHVPLARSAPFVGHSAGGIYGDVIEEIDASTGRILDALTKAGLDRRTLVVFTSDNGPWLPYGAHAGSAGAARQRQGHDVGRRRPDAGDLLVARHGEARRRDRHRLVDRSVRHRGAARRRDVTGRSPDRRRRSPGAADRTGAEPAAGAVLLLGRRAARRPQGPLQGAPHHQRRLRPVRRTAEHTPPLLFDLAADPGERQDVAAAHPDVVADLLQEVEAHRRGMVRPAAVRSDRRAVKSEDAERASAMERATVAAKRIEGLAGIRRRCPAAVRGVGHGCRGQSPPPRARLPDDGREVERGLQGAAPLLPVAAGRTCWFIASRSNRPTTALAFATHGGMPAWPVSPESICTTRRASCASSCSRVILNHPGRFPLPHGVEADGVHGLVDPALRGGNGVSDGAGSRGQSIRRRGGLARSRATSSPRCGTSRSSPTLFRRTSRQAGG